MQGKRCHVRILEEIFWGFGEMKVQIELWGGERLLNVAGNSFALQW